MNNQHHLNGTHEANATGHSVAPGSYDRKSLNPAYAEHMYGEPGSAIPGHAASGVNPKTNIPRTLPHESGSVPSDVTSQSATNPDSKLPGSDTLGHGGVNNNTQSHYTHGDAIPGSHASGISSNSDRYGNATQIGPGSNVHHAGAPGTSGVAGSAMATPSQAVGHNNAHPQFWKADDVAVGDNAQTHGGSTIPGRLGAAATTAAATAPTGAQHGNNSTFTRKPLAQPASAHTAMSGYDSAGVSPNDNPYRSGTFSAPSEGSGHSGIFGSGISGSSDHSLTHHNHSLQHAVADSTVPGSGPDAVHPDQGTHAPAVKYHGTVADRPAELDDPSSPVNNITNQSHNGAFGHGHNTHPNIQNQTVGVNHPGNQTGPYGPGAASHAHIQDNTVHPNINTSNIHDTTNTTHGGLNEPGGVHHGHAGSHAVGTNHSATTDAPSGTHTGIHTDVHNGAPTHDPTANKVPSAAAGARFGEKMKGMAAQGHVSSLHNGYNSYYT